jgi:hypothetical protein
VPPAKFQDDHHKGFQGLDQAFSNALSLVVSLEKRLPEGIKSGLQRWISETRRPKKPVALFHALR